MRRAHNCGLRAHVGNLGGADGLAWAYQTVFDSLDTTIIFQNGYWHYLDRFEHATEETKAAVSRSGRLPEQTKLPGIKNFRYTQYTF